MISATRTILLVSLSFLGTIILANSRPAWASFHISQDLPDSDLSSQEPNPSEALELILVGLIAGPRNQIPSLLVRGKVGDVDAVDFPNWLIAVDMVFQVLGLQTTPLPDGTVELRSPGLVTRLNLDELPVDPELGPVFSIQDLADRFGVTAVFDLNEYAIELAVPWRDFRSNQSVGEQPVILTGLPRLQPSLFTLSGVSQNTAVDGLVTQDPDVTGEFMALGTLAGGSWFLEVDQTDGLDLGTSTLESFEYFRPTPRADIIGGAQTPFWPSQGVGEYWGFTYLDRRGFRPPPDPFRSGGVVLERRLQALTVSRDITGRADPGTLVQLVSAPGEFVVDEVLVDSSGIYRFENVPFRTRSPQTRYQVRLFAEGRLTEVPEARTVLFEITSGQLPVGASALVISGGWGREQREQQFGGVFTDFRGGILTRWGLTESLTVGVGGVRDGRWLGLGELFFRPQKLPLEVEISGLMETELTARVRYTPTQRIYLSFDSNTGFERWHLNWQPIRQLGFFTTGSSNQGTEVGTRLSFQSWGQGTNLRLALNADNNLRWRILQRLGPVEFNQFGNEVGITSELRYGLSGSPSLNTGHSIELNHEARTLNDANHLVTLGWEYQSPKRTARDEPRWETDLSYGVGSQGQGLRAGVETDLWGGLRLRGRYQQVSVSSDDDRYSLELLTRINLQRGISAAGDPPEELRTQGGFLVESFFDGNGNGRRDAGEAPFTEAQDLLLVNNQPLRADRLEARGHRLFSLQSPDTYRVDLDPAGFPLDWQAKTTAYRVEVVPGSYTPIVIPLTPSYTISGVITDAAGEPINGARVEAVPADDSDLVRFSITNLAGVYFLEGLQQGSYEMRINGLSACPSELTFENASEPFQELNLSLPDEGC